MELAIENRAYAYRKVVSFIVAITLIVVLVIIKIDNFRLVTLAPFLILGIAFIIFYIRSHNIEKAYLIDDKIEVFYKKNVIKVPIKDIGNITSGLNYYIVSSDKLSVMYRLDLNRKYAFGRKIYLKFKYNEKSRLHPQFDPEPIQIIKRKLK